MNTNVSIFSKHIPAGVISGMEAFYDEATNTKYLGIDGDIKRFDQWPTKVQNEVVAEFRNDKDSQAYLKAKGVTGFQDQFERWYKCVIGGFDGVPDFNAKGLCPDVYTNTCTNTSCPDRGKLCGKSLQLRNFEVETIQLLSQGYSINQASKRLFVTVPAVKKRVEVINQKLGSRNMASMIATSASLGII